jgi:putative hydrolase of the HAD superfamily
MSRVSLVIRAVVFDFGGVLSYPPTDEDWHALAGIIGAPLSSFFEPYWKYRNEYDVDKFDSAVYWRKVVGSLGRALTDEDVHQLVRIDNQAWGRENPNTIEVVRAARAAGLKVAVLSNIHADMLSYVRRSFPSFSEFDVQVFSNELGIAKPSPEIFLHTATLLGVCPEEILFVDDLQPNIDGAARVGMKTMRFESPESYVDLEQLLLDLGAPLDGGNGGACCGTGGEA